MIYFFLSEVMYMNFKNSNQLKSFMKKEAERLGFSVSNAYSTFFARTFLQELSQYNTGAILIKGSSAETAYLGKLVRAIIDVDLAIDGNYSEFNDVLDTVMTIAPRDNLSISLKKEPRRTPTGIYKNSIFMSALNTGINITMNADVQENYNRLIEKKIITMPKIFEGDIEFNVHVPSYEEYLAEKLCIIVESNKTDMLNTRVKDFYDIYQLHGDQYDANKLYKYFKIMLEKRNKIKLEDVSTEFLDQDFINRHEQVWNSTVDRYGFIDKYISLAGAVYYVRAVLREVLKANGVQMQDFRLKK